MWKTLDDAVLDSFYEAIVEQERREDVLVGALLSILKSLDAGGVELRASIRETATSALHECGINEDRARARHPQSKGRA